MKHNDRGEKVGTTGTTASNGSGETRVSSTVPRPQPDLDGSLADDPLVRDFFGPALHRVRVFADLLADEGVKRGLIGPSEVARLWRRHILNSAAIAAYLPDRGAVVDVGTGAGLPGVVLAAMRPDLRVILLEPMERRVVWLREVTAEMGLTSAEVVRGRAEDLHGQLLVETVTARAVAPLERLVPWTLPLLKHDGTLLAMKGVRAAEEARAAAEVIDREGGGRVEILSAETVPGVESTTVVRVRRDREAARTDPRRRRRA